MSTANYITQAEFQAAHPEVDLNQYTAATVSGMINRASRIIDNYCQVEGLDLDAQVNEKAPAIITKDGDLKIFPRRPPVLSVSGLRLHRGTVDLTLTITSGGASVLEIPDPETIIVYPNTALALIGTFSINDLRTMLNAGMYSIITYTGGYQTIPEPIKEAAMLYLRDMVNRRLNAAGASSITQGGITIKYSNRDDGKSDDVQDAESLLDPYARRIPA